MAKRKPGHVIPPLDERTVLRFKRQMVKANAREAALKTVALLYDESIPPFIGIALTDSIAEAAYELGIFEDRYGCWPVANTPADEITRDVKLVEEIYLKGGRDFELTGQKGATQ